MNTTHVITHSTDQGLISACAEHENEALENTGLYYGVHRGLHVGECLTCYWRQVDSEPAVPVTYEVTETRSAGVPWSYYQTTPVTIAERRTRVATRDAVVAAEYKAQATLMAYLTRRGLTGRAYRHSAEDEDTGAWRVYAWAVIDD